MKNAMNDLQMSMNCQCQKVALGIDGVEMFLKKKGRNIGMM
jgi:hypothetical protein